MPNLWNLKAWSDPKTWSTSWHFTCFWIFFFLTRANLYLSSIFIPYYVNIFINFSPFASFCFPLKDREEDFDCQICPSWTCHKALMSPCPWFTPCYHTVMFCCHYIIHLCKFLFFRSKRNAIGRRIITSSCYISNPLKYLLCSFDCISPIIFVPIILLFPHSIMHTWPPLPACYW